MRPVRVRVLSGAGRYSDPWHPFAETSRAVAEVLTEQEGWQVDVVPDEPAALSDLEALDLLVVNTGGGRPDRPPVPEPEWDRAQAALAAWVRSGGPVLGLHAAAMTFPEWPAWAALMGGRWVPGVSMHPPIGEAELTPVPGTDHPVLAGLTAVHVHDERYSHLEVAAGVLPLLSHEHDGQRHVMAWVHQAQDGLVVYDGLGHDHRSYDSPERRTLLRNEAAWLVRTARAGA